MALNKKENDRRRKFRFGIQREIRYKLVDGGVLRVSGAGNTLNMCSGGVAFSTEQALKPRACVELSTRINVALAKAQQPFRCNQRDRSVGWCVFKIHMSEDFVRFTRAPEIGKGDANEGGAPVHFHQG